MAFECRYTFDYTGTPAATGFGQFIKPEGAEIIIAECWGPGGAGYPGDSGSVSARGAGGAGGQYASSTLKYSPEQQTINFYVAPTASWGMSPIVRITTWDTNVAFPGIVVAPGGQDAIDFITPGLGGASPGSGSGNPIGDVVYIGGSGGSGSLTDATGVFGAGGGGAGSTGNGKDAVTGPGGSTVQSGGSGGAKGVIGSVYGGGGGGGRFNLGTQYPDINGNLLRYGPGARGLIAITTINEKELSKIEWNGNTINIPYALDNLTAYTTAIDNSEYVRTENGEESSWTPSTNFVLEGDVRWIPTTSTVTQTGWDGATGWRAFLEYARAKNKFNFYLDAYGPSIESYLVEPLDGEHTLELDGTRRIRLVIRNNKTSYRFNNTVANGSLFFRI